MRALALVLVVLAGCARERDRDEPLVTPTWRDDVAAVVSDRCAGCHGGATPAGSYDLTSYLGALGGGTDARSNAIAGDATSAILTVLDDAADHADFADVRPLLRAWVVEGRVGYFDSAIHEPGILDRTSGEFHGHELEARGWDFALCQRCHGDDFGGSAEAPACTTCHREGPTSCDTCHEATPRTGPHPAHRSAGFACAECHRVPARWDDPGHILIGSDVDPAPAEVIFGAMAARDLDPPRRTGPPAFDPVDATCSNVFCHGGVFADAAARTPMPVWSTAGDQATCGGCHGLPPSDHAPVAADQCGRCHRQAPGDHLDGVVELGDGSGTCSACHGDATSPAPPRGLGGEALTSALAVGAHRSHLAGASLGRPVACNECHRVPSTILSPGHLDSDLPAEVVLSSGTWDRGTATCAGASCHGAATPVWTNVGVGEAACGTCHGVPPVDATHDPSLTVFDCVDCHPAFDQGHHMDGHVDL